MASLGHPCKFQRVSCLGSVTAWHCSSGRQANFAVLNRGLHLYSAGRPSRWALAHISSCVFSFLGNSVKNELATLNQCLVKFDVVQRLIQPVYLLHVQPTSIYPSTHQTDSNPNNSTISTFCGFFTAFKHHVQVSAATVIVLYTKVDAQCDKMATVISEPS